MVHFQKERERKKDVIYKSKGLRVRLGLHLWRYLLPLGDLLAIYPTSLSLRLCYLKIWDEDMYLIRMWWGLKDNVTTARAHCRAQSS